MTASITAGRRARLRDAALLSATILGTGLLSPAHAAQFGVNNYLVKPFTVASLRQKIEEVYGALT